MRDDRDFAPAAGRNKDAILSVMKDHMADKGQCLEIASGTGEHICHLAASFPSWSFQPTEYNLERHASIQAHINHDRLNNVEGPIALDVLQTPWPLSNQQYDLIFNANLIHISPFAVTEKLIATTPSLLLPKGQLVFYGPFNRDGTYTSDGNARFDASLRSQNSDWGIRDMETIIELAKDHGLALKQIHQMPANNLMLFFQMPSH